MLRYYILYTSTHEHGQSRSPEDTALTIPAILDTAKQRGHTVFRSDFTLNIVAVRAKGSRPGKFDDRMEVWWSAGGVWHGRSYTVTTDPGRHFLQDPLFPSGESILLPGQYKNAYELGDVDECPALVQRGAVKVHRGEGLEDKEIFAGINILCADPRPFTSKPGSALTIGRWSAGCLVFKRPEEYRDFIALLRFIEGPYTVTLIEEM